MKEEIVTHFKILDKLGSGGMGEVYKAIDLKLNRSVALKFLPSTLSSDPDLRRRLLNEAEAASLLDHKNICTIYEVSETEDDRLFIAMAYYEGETLKEKLLNRKIIHKEAIEIVIQVAEGLLVAHQNSIIHRDIKPENLFITTEGTVKILDFGIAKISDRSQNTRLQSTPGTIAYMSPEQIKDEPIDIRTDIWSLGVVFYEMLTGHKPFTGSSEPAIIYSILNEEPTSLRSYYKDFPNELEDMFKRLFSKNKNYRYSSLYELIKGLKNLLGQKLSLKKKILLNKKKIRYYLFTSGFILLPLFLFFQFNSLIFQDSSNIAPKTHIAVVPFSNGTGDSTLNYLKEVVPNLLITGLEQTNYFDILTLEELKNVQKRLYAENRYQKENTDWFKICGDANVELIIFGNYTKAGENFISDIKIQDVSNKNLVSGFTTKGIGYESILLEQVDEMTKEIARNLGVLNIGDIKNWKLVSEATTKSIEAYNYYIIGREEFYNLNFQKSKECLDKAVELDSSFALAYTYLGITNSYLHNTNEMNDDMKKAKKLSYKVSQKERGIIEAQYAILIDLDLDKMVKIYEKLEKQYPRDEWFHICLGYGYTNQGKIKEAIQQKEKVLEINPLNSNTLNSLGYIYVSLKEYDTAYKYFSKLAKAYPNDPNPFDSMGDLFLMKGDLDKSFIYYSKAYNLSREFGSELKIAYLFALKQNFNEAINWVNRRINNATSDGDKSIGCLWNSFYHFLIIDYNNFLRYINEAEEFAEKANDQMLLGRLYYLRTWLELERNNIDLARQHMKEWLELEKKIRSEFPVQLTLDYNVLKCYLELVSANDQNIIEENLYSVINTIKQNIIIDSTRFKNLVQLIKATNFFNMQKYNEALKIKPSRYLTEMAMNHKLIKYNLPTQIDIYAKCYEKLGLIDEAIEEYRRLAYVNLNLDERRICNPIYHYRLGKLYDRIGRREAIIEYQTFLNICKDSNPSDPDILDTKIRLQILTNKQAEIL